MVSTRKSFGAPSSPAISRDAHDTTAPYSRELKRLAIDANVDGLLGKRTPAKQEQPRATYSWRGSIYEVGNVEVHAARPALTSLSRHQIQGDEPPDFFERQSTRYLKRKSTHAGDGDLEEEKEIPERKKRKTSAEPHVGEHAKSSIVVESQTLTGRKRKRAAMEYEDTKTSRDTLASAPATMPTRRYKTFSLSHAQPPPGFQPGSRYLCPSTERYHDTAVGGKEDMASLRAAKKSAKESGLNVKAFSQAELERNRIRNKNRHVVRLIQRTAKLNAEIGEKQKEYAKLVGDHSARVSQVQGVEGTQWATEQGEEVEPEVVVPVAEGNDNVKSHVDLVMALSKNASRPPTSSLGRDSSANSTPQSPPTRPRYDSVTAESLLSLEAPLTKGRCEEQVFGGRMAGESLAAKEKREEREREVLTKMMAVSGEEGPVLDL